MIVSLNGRLRSGIILVLLLLAAGCAAGLLWNNFLRPVTVTENVKVYSYQQAANIDYRVNLLPNNLFAETSLGPGQAYITSLVDSLQTEINYALAVENQADITGTYQVSGSLVAYTEMGKDTEMEVWRRDLSFLGSQTFTASDNKAQIQQSLSIPINSYALFAEAVQEATKFSPSRLELKIDYLIKVQGKTEAGNFTDELHPTLIIPLQGKVFAVQGETSPEKEGAIEKETIQPAEGIQATNIGLGIALLLAGLLCVGVLMLTKRADTHLNPEERKLVQILRQHGERVVTLTDKAPTAKIDQVLLVDNFEDLVKAADEIDQPILHEIDAPQCRHNFYVMSNPYVYQYSLLCQAVNQKHLDEASTDSTPAL